MKLHRRVWNANEKSQECFKLSFLKFNLNIEIILKADNNRKKKSEDI